MTKDEGRMTKDKRVRRRVRVAVHGRLAPGSRGRVLSERGTASGVMETHEVCVNPERDGPRLKGKGDAFLEILSGRSRVSKAGANAHR